MTPTASGTGRGVGFVRLGAALPRPAAGGVPEAHSDHPLLARHLGTPWLTRWMERHFGVAAAPKLPTGNADRSADAAGFTDDALARHCFIAGAIGSGKTRAYLRLCERALEAGHSLVALEPVESTVLHLIEAARRAGVPAENVVLFLPREAARGGRVPGWNPLLGADPAQTATEFADSVWASAEKGVQMAQTLTAALAPAAVAGRGMSVLELERVVTDPLYREWHFALPPPADANARIALGRAADYFRDRFVLSTHGQPVTNKISPLLENPFLRRVVCAHGNAVDLDALWTGRKPGVVLAHLDPGLGDEGVRFLAGTLAHALYRAAWRAGENGRRPVVLGTDEAGMAGAFLGKVLLDILRIARGRNLRMVLATQYAQDLPGALFDYLTTVAGARAYFRLGPKDAERVGPRLPPEGPAAPVLPARVELEPARLTKDGPDTLVETFPVLGGDGRPLACTDRVLWESLQEDLGPTGTAATRRDAASVLLRWSGRGRERLYVPVPGGGHEELFAFARRLSDGEWWIGGPRPLSASVRFPRPRARALPGGSVPAGADWTARLLELPDRRAVLHEPGRTAPTEIATDEVPLLTPDPAYLAAALAKGRPAAEADAEYFRRKAAADEARAMVDGALAKAAAARAAAGMRPPGRSARPAQTAGPVPPPYVPQPPPPQPPPPPRPKAQPVPPPVSPAGDRSNAPKGTPAGNRERIRDPEPKTRQETNAPPPKERGGRQDDGADGEGESGYL